SVFLATGTANAAPTADELGASALRYENAEGMTRDYTKAHALYCAAARMTDADAFLRMGWMSANGRGQTRDDAIANTLFRRAGSLGNEMGARLAKMIRGSGADKVPTCLQPGRAAARRFEIDATATPIVDQPARFRGLPTAARQNL